MNIQGFLHFWSNHNDTIIEVLVALVLLLIIYLIYRYFFGSQAQETGAVTTQINTVEIEKTLQRILDAQNRVPSAPVHSEAGDDLVSSEVASSPLNSADVADLEVIRKELAEKEKLLEEVREEARKARELAAAATAATPEAGAPAAEVAASASKQEAKIKDLEARLAEYEIISEDIADLSFYKEENIRLQNELNALKGGGGGAAPTPADSAAPSEAAAAPSAAEAPKEEPAPESTPTPEPPAEPVEPETPPTTEPTTPTEEAPKDSSEAQAAAPVEHDDIMKDFAKAVEEQKQAPKTQAPPAAKTSEQENSELMNQFENFVKKP